MVGTAASAVAGLAAQPAEEGAHQKLRVQAIGLRPPVLARYHNARGVDHMGLDAIGRSQRASQEPWVIAESAAVTCRASRTTVSKPASVSPA